MIILQDVFCQKYLYVVNVLFFSRKILYNKTINAYWDQSNVRPLDYKQWMKRFYNMKNRLLRCSALVVHCVDENKGFNAMFNKLMFMFNCTAKGLLYVINLMFNRLAVCRTFNRNYEQPEIHCL